MQLMRVHPRNRREMRSSFLPSLMDDFFTPFSSDFGAAKREFFPSVDIYEKDGTVIFEAEVPGFKKDDLKIDVKGKLITISGEKKEEEKSEGQNSYRKERRYGRFERSFHLDFEADGNRVTARYDNGILTIALEKPEEQKVKQIQIH